MWSIERGGWRCSVITESIRVADSEMTEILPESANYAKKAQEGLYTKQTPVYGKNCSWQPAVIYLESESAERAIRRCTAILLQYLGAQ